ncbi:uncharacterized protein [Eleutherodactylus coqui]|uniref:uncharacterized protein n=1 Tax=Eleutherodactylus coqui TaxID=57060 RepID=UPI003462E8E6
MDTFQAFHTHQQQLPPSYALYQRPPAQSNEYRQCYVNPHYIPPPADPAVYLPTHSQVPRRSSKKQGQGARQRQKERARQERQDREFQAQLEKASVVRSASGRPRESSDEVPSSDQDEYCGREEQPRRADPQSSLYRKVRERRRWQELAQDRSGPDQPGTSQSDDTRRVRQSIGRQSAYEVGRNQGSGTARASPLATPEVRPGATDPWHVWIIGHSFIHWAERRAATRPMGRNLGLSGALVNWMGVRGLLWPRILQFVLKISRWTPRRVILVVHAGGNDLGKTKMNELLVLMKQDMMRFRDCFQDCVLVWSDIVARRCWRGARDGDAIERVRRLINLRMSKFVKSLGGVAVRHWELEDKERGALREDGVHLNDVGLDTFLSGLQDGVEMALARVGVVGRDAP